MKRLYETLIREHLGEHRQMVFLTGPRQVGKTTTGRISAGPRHAYLNWDIQSDRLTLTRGPAKLAELLQFSSKPPGYQTVVFDEIHKYSKWRTFLKGWFDGWSSRSRTIVTGSARLDVFRRSGDSLMGRYLLYRMHPISVGELHPGWSPEKEIRPPRRSGKDAIQHLLTYGGYPEPFLKASSRFWNRWQRLRAEQLFRDDLRDLTRIQELGQMQVLAQLIESRVGQPVNLSNLASEVNISVDTVRRWILSLEAVYHCFIVRPWHRNVAKSLRKQPKIYLWDWSRATVAGSRIENFVASHLLKAVHGWTDAGLGEYGLYYLRDKLKREVDFLVVRGGKPWFLVEVKSSGRRGMNPNLTYFQKTIGAAHAFQIAFDLPFQEKDCFSESLPARIPAETLLSQLV